MLDARVADAQLAADALERAGVRAEIERVEEREDFVRALKTFAPDLVISDGALKEFDSLSALETLREAKPGTPLIIFSDEIGERDIVAALKAGAEDVLHKRHVEQLPGAVQAAVASRDGLDRLSPRQLQVLRLIADGNTNREIGKRLRLSVKTIETHRTAIMKRLGRHDVAGLVRFAVRAGLTRMT